MTPFFPSPNLTLRFALLLFCGGAIALGPGCQKPPATLETIITVDNDMAFEKWLFRIRYDFPFEVINEIKDARQQIRYQVMTEETGLEFAESQRRVYARITGGTLRDLLIRGYELKKQRTKDLIDRAHQQFLATHHRTMVEKDTYHRDKLERHIATIKERIDEHREDLERYKSRLKSLKEGAAAVTSSP